jgi:hypothetical protein
MNTVSMTRILLTWALATSLCGCTLRNWMFPPAPFSDRAPCAISPSITKEHLVAHLNKNIQGSATTSGIASWRSTNVKITATGMPPGISVPASIAVEAPRNFRLRVSEPLTRVEALDMGSNRDQFWFWAKDAQPQQVLTISHSDLPAAQRELRVPFDPDWLMEVLGVIPIDASQVTLTRGRADAPTLELISETPTRDGMPIRKVIRIDACHGIIREHALYDSRGVLIARAALADHRIDPQTGLILPRIVSFDWPAMRQSMKMVLGNVELNPAQTPAAVWQVPDKPGAPCFDLSQMLGGQGRRHPSLYGAGSPFGILPPPDESAAAHFEDRDADGTGAAAEVPTGQTTFEPGVRWDESAPAWAEPIQRASRDHLSRRPANPFAPEPP